MKHLSELVRALFHRRLWVAVAAIPAVGFVFLSARPGQVRASLSLELPTAAEAAALISVAGFNAERVAAAGVPVGKVTSAIQAGVAHTQNHWPEFEASAAALANARERSDSLARLIDSGLGTEQDVVDLSVAKEELLVASDYQGALLDDLRAEMGKVVGEQTLVLIAQLRANAPWETPLQYCVVDRTDEEWVALREALADVAVSARFGLDPSTKSVELLVEAESDPAVVVSRLGLEQLPAVKEAWDLAFEP